VRIHQVIVAALAALLLGVVPLAGSASAQGGGANTPNRYVPPGPVAPIIVPPAQGGASQPAAVMPPGVPSARDEISVTGNYPGNDARQLYCVTWSRGC
jgi:hypothetical protein